LKKGIVIKSTGSWYQVRLEDFSTLNCRIAGKFRLDGVKLTNPVAVGDEVDIEPEGIGQGFIKNIHPRRNYVVRQSPRRKYDLHLLAANIDLSMVMVTIIEPRLKPGFIDRFLLMTEPYNIPACIVFNKSDLYSKAELDIFNYMKDIYTVIGYDVLLVSSVDSTGIEELKALLKDKTTLLGGQSGVGKSTLISNIEPTLNLRTSGLSGYTGKGIHTTTFAEMFSLSFGGNIIDTPGLKALAFNNFNALDVAHNFRELFKMSGQCKFGGQCLHKNEPGCAVKAALETGEISELRYGNYLGILQEIENQNYWEINEM
jgi:ribosome biogenesis GTPase / thiamine phosphate phosphatase